MTNTEPTHRHHDPVLVSAAVAGDLAGAPLTEFRRLLARCGDCRALAADLAAISAASRNLPPAARHGDFALDVRAAGRLRRSWWRRLLGVMGGPRFGLAAPVGGALTALGLAGMLLTTVPAVSIGRGGDTGTVGAARVEVDATVPGATTGIDALVAAGSGESGSGGGGAEPGAAGMAGGESGAGAGRQEAAGGDPGTTGRAPGPTTGPTAAWAEAPRRTADTTLAVLSGSFLIVGLGLFGMRWTGRRLGGD